MSRAVRPFPLAYSTPRRRQGGAASGNVSMFHMRISDFDIGWLVGLIEGDGTFTFDGHYPAVVLKITDLDTAQRFARLLRTTVSGPYYYEGQQIGTKPYYMSKLTSHRARQFMASTAHLFSERRQEQIGKLLGAQIGMDAIMAYEGTECSTRNTIEAIPNKLVATP